MFYYKYIYIVKVDLNFHILQLKNSLLSIMLKSSKFSQSALVRLQNEEIELRKFKSKIPKGCTAKTTTNGMSKDYSIWKITFLGREGPWKDGIFSGELIFSDDYPDVAPLFIFDPINDQTLQHVNVFDDGEICIDILADAYTPDKTLLDIIIALDNFFYKPNVKSPANEDMAKFYVNDIERHNEIIRNQTIASIAFNKK